MVLKVFGPLNAGNPDIYKKLVSGGICGDEESVDFEFSGLSEEYEQNQQELADMRRHFYEEHRLPEDNPIGTIGFLRTKAQKARDAQWAKIEEQYRNEHPLSENDKKVLASKMVKIGILG